MKYESTYSEYIGDNEYGNEHENTVTLDFNIKYIWENISDDQFVDEAINRYGDIFEEIEDLIEEDHLIRILIERINQNCHFYDIPISDLKIIRDYINNIINENSSNK